MCVVMWQDRLLGLRSPQKKIPFLHLLQSEIKLIQERSDRQVATDIAQKEYEAASALLMCTCCYGEYRDDEMAGCAREGHLLCKECVSRCFGDYLINESSRQRSATSQVECESQPSLTGAH